jgi:mono/diheme cytochrome c family protein
MQETRALSAGLQSRAQMRGLAIRDSAPFLVGLAAALMLVAPRRVSGGTNDAGSPVPFEREAAVVLRARCVRCHGADEASGGLRLDSFDAVRRGGERGPVVLPGNSSASLLMRKILRVDKPAMPPRVPLSSSEIRSLRVWIDGGAAR